MTNKIYNKKINPDTIIALEGKVNEIEKVLHNSGVVDRDMVKNGFEKLKTEEPILSVYCEAFYWSMLNLFRSYMLLTTDVLKGNYYKDTSGTERGLEYVIIKGINVSTSFARTVPIAGGLVGILDDIISDMYHNVLSNQHKSKGEIIQEIVKQHFKLEDELIIGIAKAALAITDIRKTTILTPEAPEKSKLKMAFKWLNHNYESLVESAKVKLYKKNDIKLPEQNKEIISLALHDVASVISSLLKNYQKIIDINNNNSFVQDIEEIIFSDELDREFKRMAEAVNNNTKAYIVNEIIYNNTLLNHSELLQKSLKNFTVQEIAELSNKLSPHLLQEAIDNNNDELVLAGLISLGSEQTPPVG